VGCGTDRLDISSGHLIWTSFWDFPKSLSNWTQLDATGRNCTQILPDLLEASQAFWVFLKISSRFPQDFLEFSLKIYSRFTRDSSKIYSRFTRVWGFLRIHCPIYIAQFTLPNLHCPMYRYCVSVLPCAEPTLEGILLP
jgi:hypothetical protein